MHGIQQMSRGARGAAPIVPDRSVREVGVDFSRMNLAVLADELEQSPRAPPALRRPARGGIGRHAGLRAGVHERLERPGDKAVREEEILLDAELRVAPLEVAG